MKSKWNQIKKRENKEINKMLEIEIAGNVVVARVIVNVLNLGCISD